MVFRVPPLTLDGTQLAQIRAAFVDAFDLDTFTMFCQDRLERLDQHVDIKAGLDSVVHDYLNWFRRNRDVRDLLAHGMRARAANPAFVSAIAPLLGVAPLVELAAILDRYGCEIELFADATSVLHPCIRDDYRPVDLPRRAAWIDQLVWLDDYPGDDDAPLVQIVQLLRDRLEGAGSVATPHLRTWIKRHGFAALERERVEQLVARAPVPASPPAGLAIELDPSGALFVWRVAADGTVAQLRSRSIELEERAVTTALTEVAHECFDRREARAPDGTPLRIRFLLPTPWLRRVAVDQLLVGGAPELPARPLGKLHEVVAGWSALYRMPTSFYGQASDDKRRSATKRVEAVESPTYWQACFLDQIRDVHELSGFLLAFDDVGQTPSIVESCLVTPAIALVWVRAGCDVDAELHAYLRQLVLAVDDVPRAIRAARTATTAPGIRARDHLSLVWHRDCLQLVAPRSMQEPAVNS